MLEKEVVLHADGLSVCNVNGASQGDSIILDDFGLFSLEMFYFTYLKKLFHICTYFKILSLTISSFIFTSY